MRIVIWPLFLLLLSCATTKPPLVEYVVARTALRSARMAEAGRFSPGFWHRASDYYNKGEKLYRQGEFAQAERAFKLARSFAERAENISRIKKFKGRDGGI